MPLNETPPRKFLRTPLSLCFSIGCFYSQCATVARCLTGNMANACLIYGKFWAKNFENGNIFGNIDFSLQNGRNFWQY